MLRINSYFLALGFPGEFLKSLHTSSSCYSVTLGTLSHSLNCGAPTSPSPVSHSSTLTCVSSWQFWLRDSLPFNQSLWNTGLIPQPPSFKFYCIALSRSLPDWGFPQTAIWACGSCVAYQPLQTSKPLCRPLLSAELPLASHCSEAPFPNPHPPTTTTTTTTKL